MAMILCPRCGQCFDVMEDQPSGEKSCPHCGHEEPPTEEPIAAGRSGFESYSIPDLLRALLSPAEQPEELGRLGLYRVLKVLAVGGMSIVFQAEVLQAGWPVALKVMLPGQADPATLKMRFLQEGRILASLSNKHIVRFFDGAESHGVSYLALELLQGESLEERLRREGVLPIREVLRIARETGEGLEAVHALGVVHRDINPANLWLEDPDGCVKILDFGLARSVTREPLPPGSPLAGTPEYMAPEQANLKPFDSRCDLFSLGCVLYQMSTGKLPFRRPTTLTTLLAIALEDPRPPDQINPHVPPALGLLIQELLQKEPDRRPASARALIEAVQDIERRLAP